MRKLSLFLIACSALVVVIDVALFAGGKPPAIGHFIADLNGLCLATLLFLEVRRAAQ